MRAAVLEQYGVPRFGSFVEPVAGEGQLVVEVLAAGLNPVDVALAAGTFYAGKPPLPSVPGSEGVGRIVGSGQRVYFTPAVQPHGSLAERALVAAGDPIELPDGLDDELAVALGVAGLAGWLPLAERADLQAGETVLVLGATGSVGQVAVQAAKLLGAGRVVAAGRDAAGLERARELGADATVELTREGDELVAALHEAAQGDVDVVVDPLWGAPAAAALQVLGHGGRLVQIGQSAGAQASLPSAPVRGKRLDIRGYSNLHLSSQARREAYLQLVEHALAGSLTLDVQRFALEDVADAWAQLRDGARRKLVVVP